MVKKAITDLQLRAWLKRGEPMPAKALGDGLYFRIRDSGTSQFYYRYRFGSKNGKWYFLGRYPDMSLAEARDEARECRVLVRRGIDPAVEKQRAKAEALQGARFATVADEWFAKEIRPRYKHPDVVERVLRKWVKPHLGDSPIGDVTPMQVDRLLGEIARGGAPTVSNDALRYIQRIFRYARKRHIVGLNPVADFDQSDAGGQESSRERFLSGHELRKLFAAMSESRSFGRDNELAVKLLLLLCVRKMELLSARWEDMDLVAGLWRLSVNKSARPTEIPLPALAISWLHELQVRACKSAFVFPARRVSMRKRFPHVGPDTLNRALEELGHGLAPFTVHDLRRTARSHLSRIGVTADIAERCLNHKIRGVQGTYDRHDYFFERQNALAAWASELEAMGASG
ncbi:tyrosine-type recombinase/integrase [Spectribacter hydrogenooxidans]|uniref:Integrase arm-type DNA-binding domain-containing protein n=1 Tax=Spectribacter hydrogenoxidans TaxID=3075608 RepID=A0ABU3C448_9GAMM|nr:integrase arm-type DNA-binding domain-containing protein [Salinisphaera sp. W335]MDT0636323.1 integrase arm-type DNA-binding domain-containing protein [Salinisphaera sp. W335]